MIPQINDGTCYIDHCNAIFRCRTSRSLFLLVQSSLVPVFDAFRRNQNDECPGPLPVPSMTRCMHTYTSSHHAYLLHACVVHPKVVQNTHFLHGADHLA